MLYYAKKKAKQKIYTRIQGNGYKADTGRRCIIQRSEREYGIAHGMIQKWERIYLTEGLEGLALERRGRGSTGRAKKLPKEVEEDLLAEVQRLRAENEYLKNLQALVLERERRQGKKPR